MYKLYVLKSFPFTSFHFSIHSHFHFSLYTNSEASMTALNGSLFIAQPRARLVHIRLPLIIEIKSGNRKKKTFINAKSSWPHMFESHMGDSKLLDGWKIIFESLKQQKIFFTLKRSSWIFILNGCFFLIIYTFILVKNTSSLFKKMNETSNSVSSKILE